MYPEGSLELHTSASGLCLDMPGWLMVNVLLCPWKLREDLEEQDCCPSTCSSETGVYNTVIICSKVVWSLRRQTARYNGSLVPNSHPLLGPELVPKDVYNKLLWFVTSTWFSQSHPFFFFSFLPAFGRGIAAPSVKYADSGNKMHQQP